MGLFTTGHLTLRLISPHDSRPASPNAVPTDRCGRGPHRHAGRARTHNHGDAHPARHTTPSILDGDRRSRGVLERFQAENPGTGEIAIGHGLRLANCRTTRGIADMARAGKRPYQYKGYYGPTPCS